MLALGETESPQVSSENSVARSAGGGRGPGVEPSPLDHEVAEQLRVGRTETNWDPTIS